MAGAGDGIDAGGKSDGGGIGGESDCDSAGTLEGSDWFLGVFSGGRAAGGSDDGAAKQASERIQFAVNGGFMQILPDHVVILTDVALSRAEIDVDAARADLKRAEEALALKRGADDTQERGDVAWAQARLAITARPV